MTVDYTKMTVADLRAKLVELGYDEEGVEQIKGKSNLISELEAFDDDALENINLDGITQESMDSVFNDTEAEEEIPSRFSLEWEDWIMSQFGESEMNDGNPNVKGLRRLANIHCGGEIIVSHPVNPSVTVLEGNVIFSQCQWEIEISTEYGHKLYGGCADASVYNCDGDFGIYPTAMAEVRAETRALKRVLGINNVSSEEMSSKTVDDLPSVKFGDYNGEANVGMISPTQISFITKKCEQLNINVEKFINSGNNTYSDITEVPRETASGMAERITQYLSASTLDIPQELLN